MRKRDEPFDTLSDAILDHIRGEFSPIPRKPLLEFLVRRAAYRPQDASGRLPDWSAAIDALIAERTLQETEEGISEIPPTPEPEPTEPEPGFLF